MKKITVTPEQARKWLDRQKPNPEERRPINSVVVGHFVEDMRESRWLPNGAPIVFDKDNQILDGMHRIVAVAEAGVPVEFIVIGPS